MARQNNGYSRAKLVRQLRYAVLGLDAWFGRLRQRAKLSQQPEESGEEVPPQESNLGI
jgi:hypothetical protein